MSEAANKATELVAEVADEVADQATQVAIASRRISGRDISLVFGGVVVGAGLGATLGFVFSRRALETKYNQIAEEEIEQMREHFRQKTIALQAQQEKVAPLQEKVEALGYSVVEPPLVVRPPEAVVEAAETTKEETVETVEVVEPEIRNVFENNKAEEDWDFYKERTRRSPTAPYVIHRDEREEMQSYDEVTLTYYEEDDVLCNERDEILDREERERIIGEKNLERFGHGSGDASIVYVRNDTLEAQFEVVRSPNSYAEEVHGFQHADTRRIRRERPAFDDD